MNEKICKVLTVILTLCICVLSGFLVYASAISKSVNKEEIVAIQVEEKKTVSSNLQNSSYMEEDHPSNTKINEVYIRDQITRAQQENERLRADIDEYEKCQDMYGESDAQKIADAKLVTCYEENVVIGLEIKALVLQSLGVDIPVDFTTNATALDDYSDYFKEETVGKLASAIGVDDVNAFLENGIGTIDELYENGDSFEDVLNNARGVAVNGVVSSVEQWCLNTAEQVLDETTGGLYSIAKEVNEAESLDTYLENEADEKLGGMISSIKGIKSYESSIGELLNGISSNANSSAKKISSFLNKETISSEDIRSMMYQYKQFGDSMDTLGQYGVSVDYSWKKNYEEIEYLYERFLYNEVMMELLNREGESQ